MVQKSNNTTNTKQKIMKLNYYLKLLLGAMILVVLYFLYDFVFTDGVTLTITNILWGLVSNIFVVAILSFYVSHATLRGLRLSFSVFALYFIIGHFNILIEAYIFNVTDRAETVKQILQGLITATVFSPIIVYIFNKWDGQTALLKFENRSIIGWVWRVILGVFLYIVFYLVAGMILQAAYPGLMDFYKDKLPPLDLMLLTQFPRGFLFVVIAILILRTSRLKLIKRAVLVGLVFSILGGIAPLIPPNELMPNDIRLVHGFEVGISNFLYGLVLGYLLGQKTKNEKPITTNNTK